MQINYNQNNLKDNGYINTIIISIININMVFNNIDDAKKIEELNMFQIMSKEDSHESFNKIPFFSEYH